MFASHIVSEFTQAESATHSDKKIFFPPTTSMHLTTRAFFVISMTMAYNCLIQNKNCYHLYLYGSIVCQSFNHVQICTYEMYTILTHLYITYEFLDYRYNHTNTRTSPSTDSCNVNHSNIYSILRTRRITHRLSVNDACLLLVPRILKKIISLGSGMKRSLLSRSSP
jgi:hypothetical protein